MRIATDGWGDPDHAPVIFFHGGGQTRHSWDGAARVVAAAGWYALTVDLRGHGESDWAPDGDYGPGRLVSDVVSVVQDLERSPVAVGASLGGLTSLTAEGESPDGLLRGLVLVDVAPRMEREGIERIVTFMRARPEGFDSLDEAADAVAAYLPHRPRPDDLSGLRKNLRQTADGRYVWHWDPKLLERPANAFQDDVIRYERAARTVRCPTLVVRGLLSDVLSEEGVRELTRLIPHATSTDVSDAGHMVAGDRNDAFTDAVLAFLEGDAV